MEIKICKKDSFSVIGKGLLKKLKEPLFDSSYCIARKDKGDKRPY